MARGCLSQPLDLQADGYCLSSTVLGGLIGTSKMQIDGEPSLGEGRSAWQLNASVRMCRAGCWGAWHVSVIRANLIAPVPIHPEPGRARSEGFAELDGRAGVSWG